jgi:hypothetical protein
MKDSRKALVLIAVMDMIQEVIYETNEFDAAELVEGLELLGLDSMEMFEKHPMIVLHKVTKMYAELNFTEELLEEIIKEGQKLEQFS